MIKGNSLISEVKQGIFQVRGAKPNFYAYGVVLHDLWWIWVLNCRVASEGIKGLGLDTVILNVGLNAWVVWGYELYILQLCKVVLLGHNFEPKYAHKFNELVLNELVSCELYFGSLEQWVCAWISAKTCNSHSGESG